MSTRVAQHPISVAIAFLTTMILLTAGGLTLGVQSWWAFNFLLYVPLAIRVLLAAAIWSLLWLPMFPLPRMSASIPLWLVLPPVVLIFWLLRERTWHGDALYKIELLRQSTLQSNPYVWKEPLNSLLEYGATALLGNAGQPPEVAVALISVLAGGVYVWAVWLIMNALAASTWQYYAYLVGLFATGSSLLWFGHVENYSWVTALTMLTLAFAIRHLRGKRAWWPVGLLAGVACSAHSQAIFALLALVWVLPISQWIGKALLIAITASIVPIATLATYSFLDVPFPTLDGHFAGDPQLFWSLPQAFTPFRLGAAVQNLWLTTPLWPLCLSFIGWGVTQPVLRGDVIYRLLATAATGMLVYHFTLQNDLARMRDWDLFAIVGPIVTMAGLYAWMQWTLQAQGQKQGEAIQKTLRIGLAAAAVYTLCWIGVNAQMTLIRPVAAEREYYRPFLVAELTELLSNAAIIPATPICTQGEGCKRVALTEFVMPQNGDQRPTIFAHAPAEITFDLQLPDHATFLWLSPALDPLAWGWGGDGVTFMVKVRRQGDEQILWQRHLSPQEPSNLDWQQAFIPLDSFRGQTVELLLVTDPGPAGNDAADRAGWGLPWLMSGTYDIRY